MGRINEDSHCPDNVDSGNLALPSRESDCWGTSFEVLPVGVILFDRDGIIGKANAAARQLLKCSEIDAGRISIQQVVDPGSLSVIDRVVSEVFDGRKIKIEDLGRDSSYTPGER